MSKHARFSPSKLPRILSCTASALYAGDNKTSSYAEEGTFLHEQIEKAIKGYLHDIGYSQILEKLTPEHRVAVEESLDYFFGILEPEMTVHTEQHVCIAPDCEGTADLVMVGRNGVHICDWKMGKGVAVYAKDNVQLMAYAVGVCNMLNLYSGNVHVHIAQPRINNYSEEVYTVQELYGWRDEVLLPTLDRIAHGMVEYNPSTSACRWCPIKGSCTARIDQAFKNAEAVFEEYAEMPELPQDRFADLLAKAKDVEAVIKDVEAHALVLLKKGEKVKDLKLVHSRSSRAWTDEKKAKEVLSYQLDEDKLYTKKFISPAQAEKLVGREYRKSDTFHELIVKKQGKLTVVPESDKRQAVTSEAEAVFTNYKED